MEYRTLYITAGDVEEARRIGLALVEENLAACVNYFPVQSIYRWQGRIEENAETVLLVKTRQSLVSRVIERTKALHSYQVPCIESWKIDGGYPPYLEWIADSTEQEKHI
jgi:periplasmic divalent cation tolerance protein